MLLELKSFIQNLSAPPLIHIRRPQILERFVDPLLVVVVDEKTDLGFQLARRLVVLQLDDILHRPVIALDLALRHWVIGLAACVRHRALGDILA